MKNKQYSRMAMIGHFLKGSWHFLLLSMVFAFLVSILELYIPQIIKALVDNLIGTEPLTEGSVMSKLAQMAGGVDYLREHLGLVAGAVAVMALFIAVFRYGSNQCSNIGAQKLQERCVRTSLSTSRRFPSPGTARTNRRHYSALHVRCVPRVELRRDPAFRRVPDCHPDCDVSFLYVPDGRSTDVNRLRDDSDYHSLLALFPPQI